MSTGTKDQRIHMSTWTVSPRLTMSRKYYLSCHCQRKLLTVTRDGSNTKDGHTLTQAEFCDCSFCIRILSAASVVRGCSTEDDSLRAYAINRLHNLVSSSLCSYDLDALLTSSSAPHAVHHFAERGWINQITFI
jgi:hypothetical protein